MARKNALLRLTSRLIVRRDALRKALNGDLDSFRKFSELSVVGETSMPPSTRPMTELLAARGNREPGARTDRARPSANRCRSLWPVRVLRRQDSEARLNALPYTNSCIDCQRENERAGQSRALSPTPSGGRRFTKSRRGRRERLED